MQTKYLDKKHKAKVAGGDNCPCIVDASPQVCWILNDLR